MRTSISCPLCDELLQGPENSAAPIDGLNCPQCGRLPFPFKHPEGFTALPDETTEITDISEAAGLDAGEKTAEDHRSEITRVAKKTRGRGRIIVLAALVPLTLVVIYFAIPLVRESYNPWLIESNWKRLQVGQTLKDVEAIIGPGKPCSGADLTAAIKGQYEKAPSSSWPLGTSTDNWAKVEDIPHQTQFQGVSSWRRWKNGTTQLFIGLDSGNNSRIECFLTSSADGMNTSSAWHFATYPWGVAAAKPTGKSAPPSLPEEKLVEEYIRLKAPDPTPVEIAVWGPHDLKGEIHTVPGFDLVGRRRLIPVIKIRARCWEKDAQGVSRLNDKLYYIQEGQVFGSYMNILGDKWLDAERETERWLYGGR